MADMRTRSILYIAACAALICGLPIALAEEVTCNDVLTGLDGDNDIIVPPGQECTLRNLISAGKLKVGAGSKVTVEEKAAGRDANAVLASIEMSGGAASGEGAQSVVLHNTDVSGSVVLPDCKQLLLHDSKVGGEIKIECSPSEQDDGVGTFLAHNTEVGGKVYTLDCRGTFKVEDQSLLLQGLELKGGKGHVDIGYSSMGDAENDGCIIFKERVSDIKISDCSIHGKVEVRKVDGKVTLENIDSLMMGALVDGGSGDMNFSNVISGISGSSDGYLEFKERDGHIVIWSCSIFGPILFERNTNDIQVLESTVTGDVSAKENVGSLLLCECSLSSNVAITKQQGGGVFVEGCNFNDHLLEVKECLGYVVDVMFCTSVHIDISDSEAVCVDNTQAETLKLVENIVGYVVKDCVVVGEVHCSGNAESDSNVFLRNTIGSLTGSQCQTTYE